MIFRKRRREEEGINPTPMVDVMFNLLIFIIVTAQYTNVQALKVNLPKAETGAQVEKIEKVVITVTKEEQILLDGKETDPVSLENALVPFGKKEPQPSVFIEADEGSTTGKLVLVMDLASKAGLKKISIETKK
jgi:biopolymer transport protein ExbD